MSAGWVELAGGQLVNLDLVRFAEATKQGSLKLIFDNVQSITVTGDERDVSAIRNRLVPPALPAPARAEDFEDWTKPQQP